MDDELRPLPDAQDDEHARPRAQSVLPRRASYDQRAPRRQSTSAVSGLPAPAPGWQSPPQPYYSQAFGAEAYIEPRQQMPPPPPAWGYQLPPPQGYRPPPPRSPPPPQYYRQPYYPYQQPYAGPSGTTVDPTIFKPDPYARPPGIPASPPDPARPDVQITYTDDSATKLTQYLRRRCFNCRVTEVRALPSVWPI
ncbi:hypothetical protein CTheo_2527 [Ceratobasidium theobromae]|uniref:Uncharacterized protein n=1 Tax=Ceratobasidium theobromae TaxID=1582974 RepID=A0A5N5QR08_9AGAM|nr:hypothetical protein CTheo_2527 [Ceratobasidium theobromae]